MLRFLARIAIFLGDRATGGVMVGASALLGGIGLVSTLAALILAAVLTHGLSIRGIGSWVTATVVVWLATALATLLLPMLVLKKNARQHTIRQ